MENDSGSDDEWREDVDEEDTDDDERDVQPTPSKRARGGSANAQPSAGRPAASSSPNALVGAVTREQPLQDARVDARYRHAVRTYLEAHVKLGGPNAQANVLLAQFAPLDGESRQTGTRGDSWLGWCRDGHVQHALAHQSPVLVYHMFHAKDAHASEQAKLLQRAKALRVLSETADGVTRTSAFETLVADFDAPYLGSAARKYMVWGGHALGPDEPFPTLTEAVGKLRSSVPNREDVKRAWVFQVLHALEAAGEEELVTGYDGVCLLNVSSLLVANRQWGYTRPGRPDAQYWLPADQHRNMQVRLRVRPPDRDVKPNEDYTPVSARKFVNFVLKPVYLAGDTVSAMLDDRFFDPLKRKDARAEDILSVNAWDSVIMGAAHVL